MRIEEEALVRMDDAIKQLDGLFANTALELWADSTFDKN